MLQGLKATVYGQARMRHEATELGLKMPTDAVPQLVEAKAGDVKEAASRLAAAAPPLGAAAEGEEGATGEEATSTEGAVAGEEGASSEGAVAGKEAATGEAAESEFTPEELEIYEREYAELLAAEGVTEVPAG